MKELVGKSPVDVLIRNSEFGNVPKYSAVRSHEKMKEVLLHPELNPPNEAPEVHYFMIRSEMIDGRGDNFTLWVPGKVGDEYIKTYGHYHVGELSETYKFVSGQGITLMQKLAVDKNGKMIPDRVDEFKAVPVSKGDKLFIPAGYGHLVVNTGREMLVTHDDSPVYFGDVDPTGLPGHADYELVKQMRGFAYYVVERNGKPALLRNKRYKEIEKESLGGLPVVRQD